MGSSLAKHRHRSEEVECIFQFLDCHLGHSGTNVALQYIGTGRHTLNLSNLFKDPTISQIDFGHYEANQESVVFFGYIRRLKLLQQENIIWTPETIDAQPSSCGYAIPLTDKDEQLRIAFFNHFDMMRKYDKNNNADVRFQVHLLNVIDNDLFTKVTIYDTSDLGFQLHQAHPLCFI